MRLAPEFRQGNTGGGTGMICQGFKAGTGSASRLIEGIEFGENKTYTVAALVQANFGAKRDLRFGGVPVGRIMLEREEAQNASSVSNEGTTKDEEKRRLQRTAVLLSFSLQMPPCIQYSFNALPNEPLWVCHESAAGAQIPPGFVSRIQHC